MQQSPAVRHPSLAYDGRIGELYGIFFKNLVFTILTLGIYRFWAITNYRRYFWSRMRFQNERFEYTGTGGQLFVGFLLAGLVLIGLVLGTAIASYLLSLVWRPLFALPFVLLYLTIFVLALGAIFSAQRYRLSHTVWCGIRGGMTGSMVRYGLAALLCYAAALLTFFQLIPWASIRMLERRINASSFGSVPFAFHGRAGHVYGRFLLTFIGTFALFLVIGAVVVALSWSSVSVLSSQDPRAIQAVMGKLAVFIIPAYVAFILLSVFIQAWYTAFFERYVVARTTIAGIAFASTVTARAYLGLVVGNILLLIVTLGFGFPVILHRNAAFLARTLWITGTVDPARITQSPLATPRFGEGMFQQLDASGI